MTAIDLHVHSNCSDGTYTPAQLAAYAAKKGLSAIALTDHDTVTGIPEIMTEASKYDSLTVIPGVELSTEFNGRDIHIVGLFIDIENEDFKSYLLKFVESRNLRNEKMCKALAEGEGFDISYSQLMDAFPNAIITRAHYARYLFDKGYTKSLREAFDRYIGDFSPYYIPREKVTPEDGIRLIHAAGGLAILAHPILYGYSETVLDNFTGQLKNSGLDGIEAVYSTYTPSDERQITRLAVKYDLLKSGGSDFHGSNKADIDLGTGRGHLFVPDEFLTKMLERRNK